jgi:uncharacterized cupredoxin-like copper-binding protein
MKDRSLLILGLALIVGSLIGASLTGLGFRGRGQGWMGEHMRWPRTQGESTVPGAEEVVVRARDFSFSPSTVRVRSEMPVNITLVNEGDVVHDLTSSDLGLQVVAGPAGRASAGLTPERAGEYRFECTVPGHAEAGMVGTFVVTSD